MDKNVKYFLVCTLIFIILYGVDFVLTGKINQETHLKASGVFYGMLASYLFID